MLIIIAVAGIITPVGLSESFTRGDIVNATFTYAFDPSVFGQGTPSRRGYGISRTCGNGSIPCPGIQFGDKIQSTHSTRGMIYNPTVADNITDCFRSGTEASGDLRVNPFQVQFRQFWTARNKNQTSDVMNTTGDFALLEHIYFSEKFEVREGVVIDTINGGIGFRNHTVPASSNVKHGATWTEDLLWIEPDTSCVDTNWTVEFKLQLSPYMQTPQLDWSETTLLYRGPKAKNISRLGNLPSSDAILNDPQLHQRASIAAIAFGNRVRSLLLRNPLRNNTESSRFKVDSTDDDATRQLLRRFSEASRGLNLGGIVDADTTASTFVPPPEVITLDPKMFNLSAFNRTQYTNYLSRLYIPSQLWSSKVSDFNMTLPRICECLLPV